MSQGPKKFKSIKEKLQLSVSVVTLFVLGIVWVGNLGVLRVMKYPDQIHKEHLPILTCGNQAIFVRNANKKNQSLTLAEILELDKGWAESSSKSKLVDAI